MEHSDRWLRVAAWVCGFSVALGAFGAHGLQAFLRDQGTTLAPDESLDHQRRLDVFETGARYQMYHGLAILGIAAVLARVDGARRRGLIVASWCFLGGIVLFSGSLYVLALTGIRWLGAITPLGGVAFLFGWGILAINGTRLLGGGPGAGRRALDE